MDYYQLYTNYLKAQRTTYNGEVKRPVREKILLAMLETHEKEKPTHTNVIQQYIDNGKNVYFWSDTHFFHQNIIKYANRPFEDAAHMNNVLRNNYLKVIKDDDLVVFGGDISFLDVQYTTDFLQGLPGYKVLVLGNHDFSTKCKYRNYHIFDEVKLYDSFHYTIENQSFEFLITHYPIDNHVLPNNVFNIHGHIHDLLADKKNINIAVEQTGYQPRGLEYIESFVKNYLEQPLNKKNKVKS